MCGIEFFYFFNRPTYMAPPNSIIEMSFTFYEQHFKKCLDTTSTTMQSIHIVIPETDSCFTLANDALHQFTHTYMNEEEQIFTDTIYTGEIKGTLLSKDLWEIRVKTKGFDFLKLIYVKEKKETYYERFNVCECE